MKHVVGVALVCLCVGCAGQPWPEPPAVDQAQYQKDYSQYTTCPLPPPENRLAVAIEAGEKRFPTDQGFVQQ